MGAKPVHSIHAYLRIACITAAAIVFSSALPSVAHSQPALEIRNLVVNWPTIELYFTAECDSAAVWDAGKEYFRIEENGEEIQDFTLWCPDPMRSVLSIALVVDASASMAGRHREYVDAGVDAFIGSMDGRADEAALLTFNTAVTMQQHMTTDTTALRNGLASYPLDDGAVLWDGVYAGILEIVNSAVQQSRAVIIVTDSHDEGSTRTLAEVLSLATRNRVPVHFIAIGAVADTAALALVVGNTGGKLFLVGDSAGVSDSYRTIVETMRNPFLGRPECVISYERSIADGTTREVDLNFSGYCDSVSSVTATEIYRAHFVAETMLEISCPDTLRLAYDTLSGLYSPNPFTISMPYRNLSSMTMTNVIGSVSGIPLDIVLAPGSVPSQLHPGGILPPWKEGDTLTEFSWEFLFASTPPCLERTYAIVFNLFALDSSQTAVEVHCTTYVVIEGLAPWLGEFRLGIDGATEFCYGDSLILDAGADHDLYFWSTGEMTQKIVVKESGTYFCEAFMIFCHHGSSDTIDVTVFPAAFKPAVMRDRDVLRSTEAPVYQWLRSGHDIPGATARTYQLTETGTYHVRVTNTYGCSEMSDPHNVTVLSVASTQPGTFSMEVYPQPARDAITVHAQNVGYGEVVINVYDRLGRRVHQRSVESNTGTIYQQFNVSGFRSGVYFLELQSRSIREHRLLVIE